MHKKLILFIVGVLIFCSSDSLSMNIFGDQASYYNQFIYLFLIVVLLYKFWYIGRGFNNTNIVLIVILLLVLTTMVVNANFTLGYGVQFVSLLTGYVISRKVNHQYFFSAYVRIIYFISIVSIILFSLFSIFPNILSFFHVTTNRADVSYVNLFFYSHFLNVYRNTAVFREPGMYMIYLSIAILFELFYFNKPQKKHLLIFVIAMLTTLSTGGFVILSGIYVLNLIQKKGFNNFYKSIIFGVFIILIVVMNFSYFESTILKFDSSSNNYGSTLSRLASVIIPLNIFTESPLFGVGLSKFETLYNFYSYQIFGVLMKSGSQSTNTLFNALATYGVFYFFLIITGIFKFIKVFTKARFLRIAIFILFFAMLSNEDMRYSLLYSTIVFYGYNLENNNKRYNLLM